MKRNTISEVSKEKESSSCDEQASKSNEITGSA